MTTESLEKRDLHTEEEVQLVAFRIDKEEYAIPIVKVQEIIKINQITAVPRTKSYIDGIINLRGNVIPVIDLRARFGIERKTDLEQRRIVVVHIKGKISGFIVDSVTEVLRIRKSQIELMPDSISGDVDSSFVEGIGKLNDGKRIIILVNPDAILADQGGGAQEAKNPEVEPIVESAELAIAAKAA